MSFAIVFCLVCVGIFSIGSVSAASNEKERSVATERNVVAQSFLNQKLWLWQQRLSLKDWNLTVRMVRAGELKPRTLGNIHWDVDTKIAGIRVLDPADYTMPFNEMLQDMEFTIVHELVHLQLSSLPRSEASRRAEEHAVNQLTEALLKLDRKQ